MLARLRTRNTHPADRPRHRCAGSAPRRWVARWLINGGKSGSGRCQNLSVHERFLPTDVKVAARVEPRVLVARPTANRWLDVSGSNQVALTSGRVIGALAHARKSALWAGGCCRLTFGLVVPFVCAAGDLGDPFDQGGRLDCAGGAGEADNPAGDLVQVRDRDAVLQLSVLQPLDAFAGVVRPLLDEWCQRRVEVDDHLMQGAATIYAPGLLKELVEVEPRPFEGAIKTLGLGDSIETESTRLGAQVAVPHEVPGVLAMEDGVGIEAAPRLPLTPQRAIEQRNRNLLANGTLEQRQ